MTNMHGFVYVRFYEVISAIESRNVIWVRRMQRAATVAGFKSRLLKHSRGENARRWTIAGGGVAA